MIVIFEKEYLRELYEHGNSRDKKHRYQPDVIRKYVRCVDLMRSVPEVKVLARYNGLNLEELKGNKSGVLSLRVNQQYRIEFTIIGSKSEPMIEVCNILELSNHYK